MFENSRLFSWIFLLVLALYTGCERESIQYYEIPKDSEAVSDNHLHADHPPHAEEDRMMPPPDSAVSTQHPEEPSWIVPEGWAEGRQSSMRVGSFQVMAAAGASVDISVTVFPGDVGGIHRNINRWRGQIGLQPVDDTGDSVETVTTPNHSFEIVRLESAATRQSMLAAILDHHGRTWFIKMMGDSRLVEAEEERFLAFIRSFKLEH